MLRPTVSSTSTTEVLKLTAVPAANKPLPSTLNFGPVTPNEVAASFYCVGTAKKPFKIAVQEESTSMNRLAKNSFQSTCFQPEYQCFSYEELHLGDFLANRRYGSPGSTPLPGFIALPSEAGNSTSYLPAGLFGMFGNVKVSNNNIQSSSLSAQSLLVSVMRNLPISLVALRIQVF